jgi:hypothetical protein
MEKDMFVVATTIDSHMVNISVARIQIRDIAKYAGRKLFTTSKEFLEEILYNRYGIAMIDIDNEYYLLVKVGHFMKSARSIDILTDTFMQNKK